MLAALARPSPCSTAASDSDTEPTIRATLRPPAWISAWQFAQSMTQLQSRRADGVTTIDAASAVRGDQIARSFPTPLPQCSPELLATPIAPGFRARVCGPDPERHLRGVVLTERRAL